MKTIVLITRENEERATHASVYLCGNINEAGLFRRFVNRLTLEGGDKLVARKAIINKEYSLGKNVPFAFEDIKGLDNRTIQKIMRELDSQILAIALKSAKEEVQDKIFMNISKRATGMLKEDMEYMDTPSEEEIENARQSVIDVYLDLAADTFRETVSTYKTMKKNKKEQSYIRYEENNIVLVFRGSNDIAGTVSISLFDTYEAADNFCDYLNNLKPEKGTFIYARHAEEMVEYETTKPLLVCFDQIFKYHKISDYTIKETLKDFNDETLLKALKGLDKNSREIIMHSLPIKTADAINETIEQSDKYTDHTSLSETRKARQKIINAINRNNKKFAARGLFPEVLKD
ncbi:MAG: hypothetical protein LBQ94_03540 [Treponema sp.]|jgi:hypothetical protein|nr:hypothetical protein [Treponema sp.]